MPLGNPFPHAAPSPATRGDGGPISSPRRRLSGKAMARTGLRMMPTFPLPPLKFRTAGFPASGFKAGLSDGSSQRAGLPSSFVSLRSQQDLASECARWSGAPPYGSSAVLEGGSPELAPRSRIGAIAATVPLRSYDDALVAESDRAVVVAVDWLGRDTRERPCSK